VAKRTRLNLELKQKEMQANESESLGIKRLASEKVGITALVGKRI